MIELRFLSIDMIWIMYLDWTEQRFNVITALLSININPINIIVIHSFTQSLILYRICVSHEHS